MSKLLTNTTDLQEVLQALQNKAAGTALPELTNEGSASDLLSGKQLIDSDGNIVTGNIPTTDRAVPIISLDYASGKIYAFTDQPSGYVTAGSEGSYKQLSTQAAKTITPTKSSQTAVAPGVFTTGTVTVAAIPEEYITTTDATASASEIMNGETAYVNGNKVTGTFSIDSELSTQDDLIAQIQAAVDSLPEAGCGEPTLQSKTVTPSTSSQTVTADSGYDGLNTVTVNAIPSTYVKPTSTKAATIYTPTTSNQTIAAGTYCSGIQTIKGDANLKAENIKSGVSIFGVSGIAEIGSGETGGGNIECVIGTVASVGPAFGNSSESGCVHYMDQNGKYNTTNIFGNIAVMKDSILVIYSTDIPSGTGNITQLSTTTGALKAYRVNGDFNVKI